MREQRPAASNVHAKCGKVKRSKARLPHGSIVYRAGIANLCVVSAWFEQMQRCGVQEVHKPKTPAPPKRALVSCPCVFEDSRRIECDDID